MAQKQGDWKTSCCNPFGKVHKNVRKLKLRPVSKKILANFPDILPGEMICDTCRKQAAARTLTSHSPSPDKLPSFHGTSDELYFPPSQMELDEGNDCLVTIGQTPLTKRKIQSKTYRQRKYEQICDKMHDLVVGDVQKSSQCDESEILSQLKGKFTTASRSEKIQILTILPQSWSIRKVQAEFGTSNWMARKAKQLVKEKGVMSTPNPKPGHSLPESTVDLVTTFFLNDENSRIMPGKKDCISVRTEGKRISVQKRLVLCNLKELHRAFKDKHPEIRIGFSKFAESRPKHCVLAGASGTHSVCVCTIHQNVKLMVHGVKLNELTTSDGASYPTYKHCIASAICNPPQPNCYLRNCTECPGLDGLKEFLHTALDENMIDTITYKQWVSVDRCTLDTISCTSEEFVEAFVDKLEALIPHSFIAKQQSSYFNECKAALKPGEVLIQADFSENYSFVLQDAAQGYHWNNSQATIHPFVVYYRHSGEERHLSFVVISESLHHDTIAVFLFQKTLLSFLKEALPCTPKKIIYFSDGSAAQYKNRKNFLNLCYHKNDFGIRAEWHFSATSHGTVKRLATKASLQKPFDEQIMTPLQLFEWASANIMGTIFRFCSCFDYEQTKEILEPRFMASRTIPGTRKLHCFIPCSMDTIQVRPFSLSNITKLEKVTIQETELEIDSITGYVTCDYNGQWWLAFVLDTDRENSEVKLTFLHPSGPSRSFKYPSSPDILTVATSNILTKVKPRTPTGCTYSLTKKEMKTASDKLAKIL